MAELSEAFEYFNSDNKNCQNIDYFFTQRNLKENQEYLDKNMNRKNKQVNVIYNFLAINMPTQFFKSYSLLTIDIEIWGDNMYHFKGQIIKQDGEIPQFMIKLKEDKNIFVKLIFRDNDKLQKTFINFIPITKRFQHINDTDNLTETQEQ